MAEALTPFSLHSLSIRGFRAYLEAKTFGFDKKPCLAVFGANGSGKTSIVDALEFMFSDTGTLDRIGLKAVNNLAGVGAIPHYLAADRKITPEVIATFKQKKISVEAARKASGANRERPQAATTVKSFFTVDPIIRGHNLRRFVEEHKAEDRYAEVASWLQLSPLVNVQRNLRALRQQVKAAAEDRSAVRRVDDLVAKETGNAVKACDAAPIVDHINKTVLAPLDAKLAFADLTLAGPVFETIKGRAKDEEQGLGLAGLRQIAKAAAGLYVEAKDEASGMTTIGGTIHDFGAAVAAEKVAAEHEAEERGKAAAAMFAEVWKAVAPLFAEGAPQLDACPVCATPLDKSKAGSTAGVRQHIAGHQAELEVYATAKEALDDAKTTTSQEHLRLLARLDALAPLLTDTQADLREALAAYLKLSKAWPGGEAPDARALKSRLQAWQIKLGAEIDQIEKGQGDHTYAKAIAKIQRLVALRDEHVLAQGTVQELTKLSASLNMQAAYISAEIRKKMQALLDGLRSATNEIYREIQGQKAAPIRLELPAEDEINQQRLHLLVDFAPNREGVQPGGYLSDSQIHSLALALRLAAVKRFNRGAPIVVLDDIVTSYDADHRRSIAAMLAKTMADYQVLITTHDERFFVYLKDQLAQKDWQFLRITRLDADFGPRFADHKVTAQMVEERWANGDSAANEIRQAEEEWLLACCREFGVDIRIRTVDRAYSYDRAELADGLQAYLKGVGLEPPMVPGVNNRFLQSLQKGVIENFGSHFQDAQYGDGSIGDEKARWAEFTHFREQFSCSKCKRKRFLRPVQLKRPICMHDACQAPFEFGFAVVMQPLADPRRKDAGS